jgi:hypothetical protein
MLWYSELPNRHSARLSISEHVLVRHCPRRSLHERWDVRILRRTLGRLRRCSHSELRRVQRSRKRRIQPQGLRTHVKLHCRDRSRDGSEGGIFLPEAPQQLRGSSILRELETHPRKGATPGPCLGSYRNIPGYPGSNEYTRNKRRKASPSITRMREIHAVITLSRQARAGNRHTYTADPSHDRGTGFECNVEDRTIARNGDNRSFFAHVDITSHPEAMGPVVTIVVVLAWMERSGVLFPFREQEGSS